MREIGWRGFALGRLQTRFSPVPASLLLGIVWGAWHLPLFFSDGAVQEQIPIVLFVAQTTATSVVYTWVVNRTRSVLHAVLFHAASNTAVGLFPLLPSDTGSLRPMTLAVGLAAGVAVVLTVATRGRLGLPARPHGATAAATGHTARRSHG